MYSLENGTRIQLRYYFNYLYFLLYVKIFLIYSVFLESYVQSMIVRLPIRGFISSEYCLFTTLVKMQFVRETLITKTS
jgi:hypothetical protein